MAAGESGKVICHGTCAKAATHEQGRNAGRPALVPALRQSGDRQGTHRDIPTQARRRAATHRDRGEQADRLVRRPSGGESHRLGLGRAVARCAGATQGDHARALSQHPRRPRHSALGTGRGGEGPALRRSKVGRGPLVRAVAGNGSQDPPSALPSTRLCGQRRAPSNVQYSTRHPRRSVSTVSLRMRSGTPRPRWRSPPEPTSRSFSRCSDTSRPQ